MKQRILSNSFVDLVRTEMQFDETEYAHLRNDLTELAVQLREADSVDKELALVLYCIPQMIRNASLSFGNHSAVPAIAERLEVAWIELDQLVLACLSNASPPKDKGY